MKLYVLLWLLLIPTVLGEGDLYNVDSLVIDINISSELEVIKKNEGSFIKELVVNLTYYPKDWETQRVLSIDSVPEFEIGADNLIFSWDEVPERPNFVVNSKVRTVHNPNKITEKVRFPIDNLNPSLEVYTLPSDTIDSNNKEIIRLASRLAEGEDDLFVVVHKIGSWTRDNVEYSLSTLTESVTQNSSWVLKNRYGVCDEITNLFIALNRALGIPAKFVSGISYTESDLFENNWGPHGWAEVYFPEYGWVSFDISFGELGLIDTTHIKLKEDVDALKHSTRYYWKGKDIDLKVNQLEFGAEIIDVGENLGYPIIIDVVPHRSNVGFGSYNLIEVKIENLVDYYIAREISIFGPDEITFFEDNRRKDVLLEPYEKKSIYFIIQVQEDLDPKLIYTVPMGVRTKSNNSAETSFKVTRDDIVFSDEFVSNLLKEKQESQIKVYSREVSISCISDDEITCTLENKGNTILYDLVVCMEDVCERIDVGISQKEVVKFPVIDKSPGEYEYLVTAKNDYVSVSSTVGAIVNDDPQIFIEDIDYPNTAGFNDIVNISFRVSKGSFVNPLNVTVRLESKQARKKWETFEFSEDQNLNISILGKLLDRGENEFAINVDFFNDEGNKFSIEENFIIMNTVSIFSLDNLQHFMFDTQNGIIAIMVVIIFTTFLIAILLILRRR
ncbi:transglutaminase family protein [Nanoarchaeota archaeon]